MGKIKRECLTRYKRGLKWYQWRGLPIIIVILASS